MNDNVIFRVDAATHIGTGHLQRCLTLAHEFSLDGWHITFAMINFDEKMCDLVQESGFELLLLSSGHSQLDPYDEKTWLSRSQLEDAKEFCHNIIGKNYSLCVVDHYSIDHIWQDYVHNMIPCLVVIDDLANRQHHCEILLDQNFFPNYLTRYERLIESSCITLLGPTYALLRKEFSILRRSKLEGRSISNHQSPMMLCNFGGIGNFDLLKILLNITKNIEKYHFVIITGQLKNDEFKALQTMLGNHDHISLLMGTNQMASLMCEASFCLGASGSTVWERFCLGLNSALVAVADNQKDLLVFLDERGLIDNLGSLEDLSATMLQNYIMKLDLKDSLYTVRQEKIMSLVDGQGAQKVYQAIQGYLKKC